MLNTDADAVICDLAETYQIYDYRSLPPKTVATFCVGLRENSRIKMKLNRVDVGMDTLLLAAIADRLSVLVWQQTENGVKGRNFPEMIYDKLIEPTNSKMGFESGEDFKEYWNRIKENANGRN